MNKLLAIKLSVIVLASSIVVGCNSTNSNPTNAPQVSSDGLELIKSTKSTIAYKKEGVDFSEYNKLEIMPSVVAFKKDWKRNYNRDEISLSMRVSDKDMIRIKTNVEKLFDEVFKEELSKDASLTIVDKVSAKTLLIKPAIINLDVAAPDLMTAGMTKSYVSDAGQATLYLELYDGVSGEILARVENAADAGDNSYYHWATRVSNRADAKIMIKKWAKALLKKYDEAKTAKTP